MLTNTLRAIQGWERSLDRNRKYIPVSFRTDTYEPQTTVKQDDIIVRCNHVKTVLADVITARFDSDSGRYSMDDSEEATVCDVCDMQLINGEWI